MFIASKLVEPCPITGSVLVQYADNTYQLTELLVSLNYTLKIEYLRNDHQKMLIILVLHAATHLLDLVLGPPLF